MTNASRIAGSIRDARSVGFIFHRQPDGDAIGSAVALSLALPKAKGRFFCVNEVAPVFTEVLGPLKIERDLATTLGLYVVVDCPDLKRTGYAEPLTKLAKRRPVIVIDHHQVGDLAGIAHHYLCDRRSSSTCELVSTVIDALRAPINPPLATALLLGIHTDTGGLQHPNTTGTTLRLVSRLLRQGADREKIHRLFSPRRDLKKLQLWGRVLTDVSINSIGIAVVRISQALIKETGATEESVLGLAKYLCSIEGAKAALVLVETSHGWRGSLRTQNRSFNVGRLAKLLGGSGGRKVAGFLATEEEVSGTMFGQSPSRQPKVVEIEEI